MLLTADLLIKDRLPAASVAAAVSVFVIILSQLRKFKSIKGLGIDAQLHELNEKLGEAERLFAHIRESVGLTADVAFQLLGNAGKHQNVFSRRDAIEIADAFRLQLRSLGEDDESIEKHMMPWHTSNLRELTRPVRERVRDFVQLQAQEAALDARNLPGDITEDDGRLRAIRARGEQNTALMKADIELWEKDVFAYVAAIGSVILESACGSDATRRLLVADVNAALRDAEHYAKKLDFRNRAAWIESEREGLLMQAIGLS